MDRAAKLAAEAKRELAFEQKMVGNGCEADAARNSTRYVLAMFAWDFGFSSIEVSAAVDEALAAAGTTP